MTPENLKFIALNCTLKSGKKRSSTDVLLEQLRGALSAFDCKGEIVRVVDLNIMPGVTSNEGRGDDWPKLRQRILDADILIIGTPIWMGQPSSVAKRICERMDAFFDELDDAQRMPSYGKVAAVAVVGNEDGAHHVSAELYQALNDCGFTLPPNAVTYWVGEAMSDKNYKDLTRAPKAVKKATDMLVSNAVHLARLLKGRPFAGL
ncbi:MAG TPA: flavodoxin family protein [Pseudolabrys sp.]|jgi:multimeric flavodoxin WrbA|nr:flavodoxin family protein [Pseudolabrys sp.]